MHNTMNTGCKVMAQMEKESKIGGKKRRNKPKKATESVHNLRAFKVKHNKHKDSTVSSVKNELVGYIRATSVHIASYSQHGVTCVKYVRFFIFYFSSRLKMHSCSHQSPANLLGMCAALHMSVVSVIHTVHQKIKYQL